MQQSAEWKRIYSKTQTQTMDLDMLLQLRETMLFKENIFPQKVFKISTFPSKCSAVQTMKRDVAFFSHLGVENWHIINDQISTDKTDKIMI